MLPYWTNPLDENGNMDLFLLMEYFHRSIKKKRTNPLKKKKKRSKVEFWSKIVKRVPFALESMDAAPEVPHPRPTRLPARRSASAFFFFFFFSDSRQCGSIMLNRLQFAPNWVDSAKIRPYQPYRVVSAGGRYGRNRSENGRNLPSSFFFCESRHSMCFLRIF